MSEITPTDITPVLQGSQPAVAGRTTRRGWVGYIIEAARTRRGQIGLVLSGAVILLAVIGPFVAPYSPTALVTTPFASPSSAHLLGGDVLGRDVLSRLLAGGWLILLMAVAGTVGGIVIGAGAGATAGYLGGRADAVIMRTVDVLLAIPALVLALLLLSVAGSSTGLIIIAVALGHAPQVARVLRSATLDVAERDFVRAAQLDGLSTAKVITREIAPNLVSPLMVETGLRLTWSIAVIAGLAFLGFGPPPPAPNWGMMINENRIGIELNPWGTVAPAIVIGVLTVGVNTFTDAVARVALGVDRRVIASVDDAPVAGMFEN
jgi:peptide/nickel transport system permease protein